MQGLLANSSSSSCQQKRTLAEKSKMKIATNEPTRVMECETRHQALRFVLIVTHTRHELKSLLEYGTAGGSDPQPLPITVTNYASAAASARDVYQYIADLVEFRLGSAQGLRKSLE